jgi:hypothetical protein
MVDTYWFGIRLSDWEVRHARFTAAGGEPTLVIGCLEYCCGRPGGICRLLHLPWLATRPQWGRFPVACFWRYEKIGQLYAECMSQILQGVYRGVLSTTFDASNVRWFASSHQAQRLLRETFRNPKAS